MDHFTRYAQAYDSKNKAAHTFADKLYNDLILRFGYPMRFHHDQGAEFEKQLLTSLEKICGIRHTRTTPYHTQGNGKVEHFNQTLQCMLPEEGNCAGRISLIKLFMHIIAVDKQPLGFCLFTYFWSVTETVD